MAATLVDKRPVEPIVVTIVELPNNPVRHMICFPVEEASRKTSLQASNQMFRFF